MSPIPSSTPPRNSRGRFWVVPYTRQAQDAEAELKNENDSSSHWHIPFPSTLDWEQGSIISSKVFPRSHPTVSTSILNQQMLVLHHDKKWNPGHDLRALSLHTRGVAQAGLASLLPDLLRSLFLKMAFFFQHSRLGRTAGAAAGQKREWQFCQDSPMTMVGHVF